MLATGKDFSLLLGGSLIGPLAAEAMKLKGETFTEIPHAKAVELGAKVEAFIGGTRTAKKARR